MISVTINNQSIQLEAPDTILNVCAAQGIEIPTFCHDPRLSGHGACRICVVEVAGSRNYPAACNTMIGNGMTIQTHSENIMEARREILRLMLANHCIDCFNCHKNGDCKLQDYCLEYGVDAPVYEGERRNFPIESTNKFYDIDPQKCILCGKCVRVCNELQCSDALNVSDRGFNSCVTRFSDKGDTDCVSCGNCVSICPVGALIPKSKTKFRRWELKSTQTTCTYCGVGCQMELRTKGNRVVDVAPVMDASNSGLLCVKGKFGYNFINHPDRLTTPLIRKDGVLVNASWDEALQLIADKIQSVKQRFGADACAGLASARCTNEDNYLFQKLFRAVIGTNNVDHCARLCHASTVAGLATTLGSGAMTNSIGEASESNVILVTGSNTTETHPVIGAKIKQAQRKGAKLIVIEPRYIDLCKHADVFLQIRPGTNVAIYNGLMHVILEEKLLNAAFIKKHTENIDELKAGLADYTPEAVAEICGVSANAIRKAARIYAQGAPSAIYYSMGVTQHTTGVDGVMSISNLALLTGQIGQVNSGVNPLRGQNNVQGACDMGALPNVLPGYQRVTEESVIDSFKSAWQVAHLSNTAGLTVTEMLTGAETGAIKLLYIMGENPMLSDPDTQHVEAAIKHLDFLVVQDIFLTETAALADVVLPAASFAEKDGTFTNTERKVTRIRKAIEPVGQSRADWQILADLMTRLGYAADYADSHAVMTEINAVTPQYRGITYDRIEKDGLPWPCPDVNHPGTPVLHKEGNFTRGKGLFKFAAYKPSAELPDQDYPFLLTTGRILYHYHTKTMTGKVEGLNAMAPASYIEIHPEAAGQLGIADGESIRVTSRRGEIQTMAKVTDRLKPEVVFMPFHFVEGSANMLTNSAVDPVAKIPELKVCAVQITKV